MHHFILQTAYDLANHRTGEALALWQVQAPMLGFKHDFLLRGILAVSALHAAYMFPHRKMEYDLKASTHQSLALQSYQEVLTHVDNSNCHALFLFSCLIIVMAFASSIKDEASDFQTDILHWFYLLRGCNEVIKLHNEILSAGFLKPLLDELNYTENHAAYDIPDAERITDLFAICNAAGQEREVNQAYTLAIHSLLSTFIQASILRKRGEGMVLASFVWPINLPPRFLELLGEKQPQALVILAHYCVLIYWGEVNNTWFMVGWARYMLDTIRASIPDDWHEHLNWPESIVK